ncbi:PREDICTED: esterase E4-like [Dinoponera quadriceps]|uniref:Esterase E4-like n=1 Tax=Dinoponera quadriceps TaxID=609295 RepID=A0A6P3XDQ2_DINQU|nr:PREDICTED: esterase E4-like [Dinoponera quadriceps]
MMHERSVKFVGGRGGIGSIARCGCCVFALFVILANSLFSGPVVNIKWGPILGKWSKSLNGQPIASFLGIPYALPPLGDLRFKSPQRWNRTWITVRNSTVDGPNCAQLDKSEVIGSEDCLYLNVFMPMIPGNCPTKLPVIVYVHGGSFKTGSSDSKLYAPDYLMDHNVILVTLNYRLNVLGFFSTTNRVAPGNYGLKDIIAALHWVQENIHNFEGNPESVTMMGSSAGAALIHFLALSKKTERLFHRYILHSGTALHPWAFHSKQPYRQICLKLARLVGCLSKKVDNVTMLNETINTEFSGEENIQYNVYDASSDNEEQDEEMMKCMRTVDTRTMLNMTREFFVWRTHPSCFISPILEEESEDAVVIMHPLKVIRNGLFRDIPVIIEIVKDEGLIKSLDFFIDSNARNEMLENFEKFLPFLMEYQDVISDTSTFADAIQNFYFSGNITESNFLYNITEMIGDGLMTWPSFQTVQYQSELGKASVYFSLFAYKGTFSWSFRKGGSAHYGVDHADDMNYFFPLLNNMFADRMLHNTENDRSMIHIMTEMWTNFAREGVPRAWMILKWPDYRDHHKFMRFGIEGSPEIVVQADFLSARMEFWEKLIANVSVKYDIELDVSTNSPESMITVSDAIDHKLTFSLAILTIVFVCALI